MLHCNFNPCCDIAAIGRTQPAGSISNSKRISQWRHAEAPSHRTNEADRRIEN